MKNVSPQLKKDAPFLGTTARTFSDITEYLQRHWTTSHTQERSVANMQALDEALGGISAQVPTVIIAGSNGKTLTTHFATKLFAYEGLRVAACTFPRIAGYNEQIVIVDQPLSQKEFTDIASKLLDIIEEKQLFVHALELMTAIALVAAHSARVDVLLLEVDTLASVVPSHYFMPKIVAISRVTQDQEANDPEQVIAVIKKTLINVKTGAYVVSADQSKINLNTMEQLVIAAGGNWMMPTRKLAPLAYPFEQLHGRCAALAERIAHIYINNCMNKVVATDQSLHPASASKSLLTKQKGQRGRPTHEAKRQLELHPKKTIEQFWKETKSTLCGRFQIVDKTKPTVLLDNADSIDAYENILLGIRLLHYQRPLEGLVIILGLSRMPQNSEELLRLFRYFFKKTSGQLLVCPVAKDNATPGAQIAFAEVEQLSLQLKNMKIKSRAFATFKEAFDVAAKAVDERNGLVVITGSTEAVSAYVSQE